MKKKMAGIVLGVLLMGCIPKVVLGAEISDKAAGETVISEAVNGKENHTAYPCSINLAYANGTIKASGEKICAKVTVSNRKSANVKIRMVLQKENKGTWAAVRTWNMSYVNKKMVAAQGTYAGKKGNTYRMKYTITVGKDCKTGVTKKLKI
ncbi:MAG: hypothetical protein HFI88_02845 [Lachnospiraceae bacterium]|nr:hypothetical protein [Lachnospiraceae bacterium]